jgi:hypothetical protein
MKRRPINEIVKDPRWQKVRESLLGQWAKRPQWCCQQLSNYLGPLSSASNDELRIVMNYLVGSGFRTGKIKHPCITSLRSRISSEIASRKVNGKWYD